MMPLHTEMAIKEGQGMQAMEEKKQGSHSTQADHLGKWRYDLSSSLPGRWRQVGAGAELQGLTCD